MSGPESGAESSDEEATSMAAGQGDTRAHLASLASQVAELQQASLQREARMAERERDLHEAHERRLARQDERLDAMDAQLNALAQQFSVAQLEIKGMIRWLGTSHEPWLLAHEGRINSLAVRLQAHVGHLDARLHDLTLAASRLPGARDQGAAFDALTAWREQAKQARLLPRGETGPCEGVRVHRGSRPILVIAFSGKQDVFGWMARLQALDVSVIHLVDTSDRWYLDGCDGARRIDWMLEMIAEARGQFAAETTVTLGVSMGGYAALRFAEVLKADCAIAFGPQTHVVQHLPAPDVVFCNPPPDCEDIRPVVQASPVPSHVFIGQDETANPPEAYFWNDLEQTRGMAEWPNVELHVVDCHDHGVSIRLTEAGLMDAVLEEVFARVGGAPPRLDLDRLLS